MSGQIGQVTRLTSANLHIEFQPVAYPRHRPADPATGYAAYGVVKNHVTVISFGGAVTGTFKLRVNGHLSGVINIATILALTTAPTPAEGIQAILEAMPNVGAGDLLVTGTNPFTITAAADLLNEFLVIEIEEDTTTGATVSQSITAQGSKFYRLDAETRNFSYTSTQEATDVSGISESSRRESSTISDATFDLGLYEAVQDYRAILEAGVEGYLRVFEDGKAVGKRYFAWEVLLKEAGSSFEAFEKIEIDVSGRRQGAPLARVGSIWAG